MPGEGPPVFSRWDRSQRIVLFVRAQVHEANTTMPLSSDTEKREAASKGKGTNYSPTHPNYELRKCEWKGNLSTSPSRTVVMTSHERSAGAAKKPWNTFRASEEIGASQRFASYHHGLQTRTSFRAQLSIYAYPRSDGATAALRSPILGREMSLGDTPSQLRILRTRETNNHVTGVSGQRQGAHGLSAQNTCAGEHTGS